MKFFWFDESWWKSDYLKYKTKNGGEWAFDVPVITCDNVSFAGMVDICMLGALWPSPKLALGNARYTASCSNVACMERRWNRLLVLGCELLWEGNSSQCWGYCLYIIALIWLKYSFIPHMWLLIPFSRLDSGVVCLLEMESCFTLVRYSPIHSNLLLH